MKTALILLAVGIYCPVVTFAQKIGKLDPKNLSTHNCTVQLTGDDVHLISNAPSTAIAWLRDIDFRNGTIELDLKGKDVRAESFVGIAFHALNDSTYSAIYFRPFNFSSEERRSHSVQFIDKPGNDWDLLRERHPGKYESALSQQLDPNDWFHVRIEIAFPDVRVFVANAKSPSLEVKQISPRTSGKIGLWIDSKDGWFRNLTYSKE
jgi:hypothetical protein